jgi:CRISPR-associated protein Csd2
MALSHRYDFVFLFDVQDGNPNGDPDAGNMPRIDAETGHGLVTDVCLKRKIRNYVGLTKGFKRPFDIYVKERAVLGRSHVEAFQTLDISLGEEVRRLVPEALREHFEQVDLPEGLSVEPDDEGKPTLALAADLDKKEAQARLKELDLHKEVKKFIGAAIKDAKSRRPTRDETERGRDWLCANFYDIRTFGAVLSLKSAPNCGQVRGPVQMTFARSLTPIVASEHSITRMAVATEAEAEKQQGDNRTMGRKFTVPYGVYRAHGFVSASLANQTGFAEDDLKVLWEGLSNMFEHDRSAARGLMSTRGLYVFEHESPLGNAAAHRLFERVSVTQKDPAKPARSFSDFAVDVSTDPLPPGVKLHSMA